MRVDAVRRHLERRGVGEHVVEGGLDYLVASWAKTAADAESGERWCEDEWLNDLDGREILQDLFDHVPESRHALDAVEAADSRFAASTTPTDECRWGDDNAARHGWTRERSWWYWRRPSTPYL